MSKVKQIDAVIDPGFSSAGAAAGQPFTAAQLATLVSNDQIETTSDTIIPAKDRPNVTVNDMIYAIRVGMAKVWSDTPGTYAVGSIVSHLGKYWYCNATAAGTDIPGTSNKWTSTGAPHIS